MLQTASEVHFQKNPKWKLTGMRKFGGQKSFLINFEPIFLMMNVIEASFTFNFLDLMVRKNTETSSQSNSHSDV